MGCKSPRRHYVLKSRTGGVKCRVRLASLAAGGSDQCSCPLSGQFPFLDISACTTSLAVPLVYADYDCPETPPFTQRDVTFMCKIWSISGPGGWLAHVGREPKKAERNRRRWLFARARTLRATRVPAVRFGAVRAGRRHPSWRKPHDSQVDRTSGAMQGRGSGKAADELGNTVESVAMRAASNKRPYWKKTSSRHFSLASISLGFGLADLDEHHDFRAAARVSPAVRQGGYIETRNVQTAHTSGFEARGVPFAYVLAWCRARGGRCRQHSLLPVLAASACVSPLLTTTQ